LLGALAVSIVLQLQQAVEKSKLQIIEKKSVHTRIKVE
jgi:hypothetical protein